MQPLSLLILVLIVSSCSTKCPERVKPNKLVRCTFALKSVDHPNGGLWCGIRVLGEPPPTTAVFVSFDTAISQKYVAGPVESLDYLEER